MDFFLRVTGNDRKYKHPNGIDLLFKDQIGNLIWMATMHIDTLNDMGLPNESLVELYDGKMIEATLTTGAIVDV